MLLEKAYAKLFSGYWNIGHGGISYKALKDLTGAPGERIEINSETDLNQLWHNLVEFDKRKYIFATGAGYNNAGQGTGLQGGHAYTLIGVHILDGERVVELRNPWGKGEWTGDWSDGSQKWTSSLKARYHPQGTEDDGRFFMPFEDFCRYFDHFDVCYYEDGNVLSSFNDELDNEFVGCYKAEVGKGGEYYVILSQEDWNAFYNPKFPQGRRLVQQSQFI